MDQLKLATTRRVTTRLGFGCAYLLPETSTLLDVAYDAGIRHFDVARSYGRGLTESVVGKFLSRHNGDITVTSKYGIWPPSSRPAYGVVRTLLRPFVRQLRRIPAVDDRISYSISRMYKKCAFTAQEAQASLETSLRNLRRDYIDIFLMHEATPEDLQNGSLMDFLQGCVTKKLIGAFGVGGNADRVPRLHRERRAFCNILQYDWTPLEPIVLYEGTFSVVYRTFGGRVGYFRHLLQSNQELRRHWSDEVGKDLGLSGSFEQLLLKASLELRSKDVVLFSSTQPNHIAANVRAAEDRSLTSAAIRLVALMQEERARYAQQRT